MTSRNTFERVAAMIGATTDESTMAYRHFENGWHIAVSHRKIYRKNEEIRNVHITLVKDGKKVMSKMIKGSASDKVIMNRINALMNEMH